MKLDKKEIALWAGGILASAAVAFLIFRLQQNDAAAAAANAANQANYTESELANQQSEVASLPSVSVPTISATPSTTDTTQQGQTDASDSSLESIIAKMLGIDSTSVTSQTSPSGNLTIGTGTPFLSASGQAANNLAALPLPTASTIPTVQIPAVNNFASASASPTITSTPPNVTAKHNGASLASS